MNNKITYFTNYISRLNTIKINCFESNEIFGVFKCLSKINGAINYIDITTK